MHDYLFTAEVVRFAFMFGVAVSMLLYERRHLTTGSIVVPGYIATFIAMPTTLIATFLNAFISYFLVNRLLRRWFLLYGRTKFTVLVMISIVIQTLMLKLSPNGAWAWESDIKLLVGVGYVVPALIAHDMGRQGIKKTLKSVLLAGVIVAIPIALALVVDLPGINDLAPLRGGSDIAIDVAWIPIAVLLSAASAWGVARFWDLRSGGFMGAAFVAILLGDPWQVVVMAVLAAMTYIIVTRFLMDSMILFGRRKFSAMLLVSASMSWSILWVGGELFGVGVQRHMDVGSLALTPLIVPGLMANDAQRTSPLRVLGGLGLATTFVLTMTWWAESVWENRPLDLGWKLAAVATGLMIFGRQPMAQLAAKLRTAHACRRAGHRLATGGTAGQDDNPWYGFAFASYHRWSALHHDAGPGCRTLARDDARGAAGSARRWSVRRRPCSDGTAPGRAAAAGHDAGRGRPRRGDDRPAAGRRRAGTTDAGRIEARATAAPDAARTGRIPPPSPAPRRVRRGRRGRRAGGRSFDAPAQRTRRPRRREHHIRADDGRLGPRRHPPGLGSPRAVRTSSLVTDGRTELRSVRRGHHKGTPTRRVGRSGHQHHPTGPVGRGGRDHTVPGLNRCDGPGVAPPDPIAFTDDNCTTI